MPGTARVLSPSRCPQYQPRSRAKLVVTGWSRLTHFLFLFACLSLTWAAVSLRPGYLVWPIRRGTPCVRGHPSATTLTLLCPVRKCAGFRTGLACLPGQMSGPLGDRQIGQDRNKTAEMGSYATAGIFICSPLPPSGVFMARYLVSGCAVQSPAGRPRLQMRAIGCAMVLTRHSWPTVAHTVGWCCTGSTHAGSRGALM